MTKIGFIDYYLSEWHANNYPAWIQQANSVLGTDFCLSYAWAELDVSPKDGITSEEWCKTFGAEQCATIEELCEKSDCILILAPTDPDRHLPYARKVLPFCKPTYIDKTFAENLSEANEIFRIAEEYKTPFFSSSALRYAEELKDLPALHSFMLTGGGGNFPEYSIHLVEMAVLLADVPAVQAKSEPVGSGRLCQIRFANGMEAALVYSPAASYGLFAQPVAGKHCRRNITSQFFEGLIRDILQFFSRGTPSFNTAQTLRAMALRDSLLCSEANGGLWTDVEVTP